MTHSLRATISAALKSAFVAVVTVVLMFSASAGNAHADLSRTIYIETSWGNVKVASVWFIDHGEHLYLRDERSDGVWIVAEIWDVTKSPDDKKRTCSTRSFGSGVDVHCNRGIAENHKVKIKVSAIGSRVDKHLATYYTRA